MEKKEKISLLLQEEKLEPGALAKSAKSSRLDDILVHFLLKFKSKNTRLNYRSNIEEFLQFCSFIQHPVTDLKDLSETHIQLWQRALEAKKNKDGSLFTQTTIAAKLSALCSLCSYAYRRKLISSNPAEFVERPSIRRTRGSTHAFREQEIHAILDELRTQIRLTGTKPKKAKNAWNHYAILATLFSVGMRVSELCTLKIFDFQPHPTLPKLRLSLKGGQQNSPPISDELADILKHYIQIARSRALSEDPLFSLQDKPRARPVSRHFVTKLVAKLAKQVGIDRPVSSHSCRASVASLLHKKGIPVGEIQDLLGHRDIKTTMLYVRTFAEESESAGRKLDILKST